MGEELDPFSSAATATISGGGTPGGGAGGVNPLQLLQAISAMHNKGGVDPSKLLAPSTAIPTPTPQPRAQNPQLLMPGYEHSYQTTGEAKRSQKEALFHNLGQVVQSYTKLEVDKKERHSQMLTTRLMTAMQGLQEAQASGDQDSIKQNANIINDIMGDPKNRKVLEKAFDINFFGKSKGKDSPEQKGLFSALQKMDQDFKGGKNPLNAYGQKFQQSFPSTQQLSPEAVAHAQAIKAGLEPTANVKLSAEAKEVKDILDDKQKYDTTAAKLTIADKIASTADKRIQAQYLASVARTQGIQEAARIKIAGDLKRTQLTVGASLKMAQQHMDMLKYVTDTNNKTKETVQDKKDKTALDKVNVQNGGIKQLNTEYSQAQKDLTTLNTEISKRITAITSYDKAGWTSYLANRGKVEALKTEMKGLEEQAAQVKGKLAGIDQRRQMLFTALQIPEPQMPVEGSSADAPATVNDYDDIMKGDTSSQDLGNIASSMDNKDSSTPDTTTEEPDPATAPE